MKILMINGSPRGKNSNTYKLSTAFVEGIKNEVDIEYEEIQVNKLNIKPCLGCFSCWNKTPGECVIKDEMKNVIEKILWADLIIWSFGLYYFNVPSHLKTLIDRQLPLVLPFMVKDSETGSHPTRYDMSNKKHVVISTCGFYTTKGNYESVNLMFDHFLGKDRYEKIYCSQGELFRVPELSKRTDEYLSYVKKAGEEFSNGNISKATKEKLNTLLYPKETFEAMADASWGIERETGEKLDKEYIFTKQMAALYNKSSFKGKEIVLEMDYTDIGKKYQIVLKKDGYEVLADNFKEFTTKIETPFSVWNDIATGKISGKDAMMKRLYKVKGDFNLMLHWDEYFGSTTQKEDNEENSQSQSKKKTNMMILLIPWIAFWVAPSISSFTGSIITIIICAITSLLFVKNKKTPYDVLSNSAVTMFSILIILFDNAKTIIPLSYLCFGLMWSLSSFTKVPLTAHYSKNNYNGESALKNPLFMKTNKILTIMWGVLYILTSIWTYFIMQSGYSSYIAIINNILPVLMGIFTKWFQNWYPAWYAKGK